MVTAAGRGVLRRRPRPAPSRRRRGDSLQTRVCRAATAGTACAPAAAVPEARERVRSTDGAWVGGEQKEGPSREDGGGTAAGHTVNGRRRERVHEVQLTTSVGERFGCGLFVGHRRHHMHCWIECKHNTQNGNNFCPSTSGLIYSIPNYLLHDNFVKRPRTPSKSVDAFVSPTCSKRGQSRRLQELRGWWRRFDNSPREGCLSHVIPLHWRPLLIFRLHFSAPNASTHARGSTPAPHGPTRNERGSS